MLFQCPETSPAGALLAFPVATAVPGSVLGLIGPGPLISRCQIFHRSFTDLFCPSPLGSLGLRYHVKTRERRGSSFSQLGLEPNHTGLTAQSLFFLEESCRVKRSDTQTFSNFSTYFKRVLKLQNVLPASPNKTSSAQTHK